ncbi:MAG: hypothetical protein V2I33_25295 [Kangiellaceae bacterium]|nr:hypothetical protein [Kangiellaceae bacterium]
MTIDSSYDEDALIDSNVQFNIIAVALAIICATPAKFGVRFMLRYRDNLRGNTALLLGMVATITIIGALLWQTLFISLANSFEFHQKWAVLFLVAAFLEVMAFDFGKEFVCQLVRRCMHRKSKVESSGNK